MTILATIPGPGGAADLRTAGGPTTSPSVERYSVRIATDESEIRAAQRLRHSIFAGELGARLPAGPEPGLDVDDLDGYCDHLVIVAEPTGEVVGTYRMLPPERAAAAGRLYAESEFDLGLLAPLRSGLVETGRSCVHADHRTGAVINLIWAGLCRYLHLTGMRWIAGCCSVPVDDGGATMAGVWQLVQARHLSPPRLRVRPHRPWPVAGPPTLGAGPSGPTGQAGLPALLRGYLRLGAWVCGPPAEDVEFGVADLFVLLSLDRIDPRYLRHFLGTR